MFGGVGGVGGFVGFGGTWSRAQARQGGVGGSEGSGGFSTSFQRNWLLPIGRSMRVVGGEGCKMDLRGRRRVKNDFG